MHYVDDKTILGQKNLPLVALALAVLLAGVQIGILLSLLTFILPPLSVSPDLHLFLKHREGISTEYESLFYRLAIIVTLVIAGLVWWKCQHKLSDKQFVNRLWRWVVISSIWILLQAFAIFKLFLPDSGMMIRILLTFALIGQGMSWMFFIEINRCLDSKEYWQQWLIKHRLYPYGVDCLAIVTIVIFAKTFLLIVFYLCAYGFFRLIGSRPLIALAMVVLAMKWGLYRLMATGTVNLTVAPAFLLIAIALFSVPEYQRGIKKSLCIIACGMLFAGLVLQPWLVTDGSIYAPLRFRQFGAFLMVFVMPIVYLSAILYVFQRIKEKKFLVIALLAVYGLIEYVQFLINPVITSFYGTGCSWAAIIGVCISEGINRFLKAYRQWLEVLVVAISLLFLITNRMWLGIQ